MTQQQELDLLRGTLAWYARKDRYANGEIINDGGENARHALSAKVFEPGADVIKLKDWHHV